MLVAHLPTPAPWHSGAVSAKALSYDSRPMPIYEYRCKKGHNFEVRQSFSDGPVTACEVCGAPVERVYHPVAVHFKGSGFYNTDYGTRQRSREKEAKEAKSKSEAASKSDSSSTSDSKSNSSGSDSSSSTGTGSGASKGSDTKSSTSSAKSDSSAKSKSK
jgi:putative FmdB family regulatory protein